MIAQDVWKETTGAMTRIIDVYINALRKKIERSGRPAIDPHGARHRLRLEGRIMKRLSIRWRLTLWYGSVLTAILVGFSGAVYLLMRHHLLALTDAALAEELADLSGDVLRCERPDEFSRELGPRYASHDGYEFQVSTRKGIVLFRSDGLGPRGLPIPVQAPSAPPAHTNLTLDGLGPMRLARRHGLGPGRAAHRPGRRLAGAERTCIEGASGGAALDCPAGRGGRARRGILAGSQGSRTGGSNGRHREGDHFNAAGSAA